MIPFVLAGLATATMIAKNKHDAKRLNLVTAQPSNGPQLTQEQVQLILQEIAYLRKDVNQLQDEMKTKVTFH